MTNGSWPSDPGESGRGGRLPVMGRIIRQGTLLTIVVLIICVLGILAALRIPVQMIPDLEVRTITVRTNWPGATPQDVEKEILIEQEEYLRNIPGMQRMKSNATTGGAEIELEFPFGVDINDALIRTNNALSQVPDYPENVDEPRLFATSFSENSFIFLRIIALPEYVGEIDINMMQDFLDDNVRPRLERVPGVSQAWIGGGAERQIQIHVDPSRLASRELTLADVREAVRDRNRDTSAGDIDAGKRRYLLRTMGRYEDIKALEETILARRGDAVVRLGDVAAVAFGHFEMRDRSLFNGQPNLLMGIRRDTGSNVLEIKEAIAPVVDELNRDVLHPVGLDMAIFTDDARYVKASVANVWQNLAIGIGLVTLVMYFFLRSATATLVGVVGIPICTIAAFLGLLAAGRTINVISLAGVAFAIGMTLDNTIVVLESIERERRRGRSPFDAALGGVTRVWPAVLASTMTTILVFTPILFVREEAGQLYSDIAVAISASILASMFVAIAVVPTLTSHLSIGRNRDRADTPLSRLTGRVSAGVAWLIESPGRSLAAVAGLAVGTVFVILVVTPPAEYLPEGEEPKVFASMLAPSGYNLEKMTEISDSLDRYFTPYIKTGESAVKRDGRVPPIAYLGIQSNPQSLRIIAEPVDPGDMDALMTAIRDKYAEYPGMRAFVTRGSIITSNDGGTRSVNLDISGPDLGPLFEVASAAYDRAHEVFDNPSVNSEPASLSLGQPLVEIRPRWERLAEMGMTREDFGYAVAALTDGAYVGEFFMGDDKIDIFAFNDRRDTAMALNELGDQPLYTPRGVVPISAVADVVETVATDNIRRINGRRTVTLNIIPPRSVALEEGVEIVRKEVVSQLQDSGRIPYDVAVDISGASDQLQATREALGGNFVVAVILAYLLMVAVFVHWGYPMLIMATVPLGIAGGILGLWALNGISGGLSLLGFATVQQPFDMITMLGFLILLGTVVNNPILIVDHTRYELRETGCDPATAIRRAVEVRLRPILMTTVTTLFGLSPLVFIPGAGTELYRGVGVVVMAGLLCAMLVTLVFLPALLMLVLQARERWRSRRFSTP